MLHLLKIEWLKLKNYRTFWILSILFLISLFGINYIPYQIHSYEMTHRGGGHGTRRDKGVARQPMGVSGGMANRNVYEQLSLIYPGIADDHFHYK